MEFKTVAEKSMKIHEITKKIGLSKEDIVFILSKAGFLIRGDISNYILNKKHLAVINQHFIDAINNLHKNSKKNYREYDNKMIADLRRFFSNFILGDTDFINSLSNENFFNSRLDYQSIEAYLYELLFSYRIKDNSVTKILKQLRYRITPNFKCNNELRKKISISFFSKHYYIFSDEDSLNASQFNRFKSIKNKMTEALKKLLIELKHLFWNQEKQHLLQG